VPYVLVSQSLGPFRRHNRPLTRYCLNKARLIYIREKRTSRVLRDMGVRADLLALAPDVAFTLPSASFDEMNSLLRSECLNIERLPRPWIGISPSSLFLTRFSRLNRQRFVSGMTKLALHVHRTVGGTVFLIPHEIRPPQLGIDDLAAADVLSKALAFPPWLHTIRGNYSPSEIKSLVSCFDAFIACRMHAGIAALSSSVPTLMISWSHKYEGVMEELGLSQFVWNFFDLKGRDLSSLWDELWTHRRSVCERLEEFNSQADASISKVVESILKFV